MFVSILLLFPFLFISILREEWYPIFFKLARFWAYIILFGMGFTPIIKKGVRFKKGESYMFVANHTSMIDIMLMLFITKDPVVFVGKKELYKIPLFGYIYKRAAIMVDRSDSKSRFEVYGQANEMLKEGYNVCVFPETNYLDDTILLADFKRGAFKIAIENNLPIIPLVFYDLKLKHPWYPKFGSLGKLRVKVLDKISVEGLLEKDIPSLTKKAYNKIKSELENDPKQAAVKATNNWKKILS